MNKPMNTKHKRVSTGDQKNTSSGRGLCALSSAGSPLSKLSKLQNALERSADRELMLSLEVYDLKLKLKNAMVCCNTFFHVAGKRAEESWIQFEKAAEMYQRLLEQEQRP